MFWRSVWQLLQNEKNPPILSTEDPTCTFYKEKVKSYVLAKISTWTHFTLIAIKTWWQSSLVLCRLTCLNTSYTDGGAVLERLCDLQEWSRALLDEVGHYGLALRLFWSLPHSLLTPSFLSINTVWLANLLSLLRCLPSTKGWIPMKL